MFLVFNKKKINSYLISMVTVIMLLAMSMLANNKEYSTIETSTGSLSSLPIYKVETEIKKVAFITLRLQSKSI